MIYLLSFILLLPYILLVFWCWNIVLNHPIESRKKSNEEVFNEKVSLVIAFRDESEHLADLVFAMSQIDYPAELLQIVLIDDHSTDSSKEIISSSTLPFEVVLLSASLRGKKQAIQEALQFVNGEVVLFTDADCRFSNNWVSSMVLKFREDQYKMLIGPVVYIEKAGFLNALYQLDFLALIGFTEASVYARRPTMANAANMGFRTDFRKQIEMDDLRGDLPSGDDVFILHHLKNSKSSKSIAFIASVVETAAPSHFQDFLRQRIRWGSKASSYKDKDTQLLSWLIFLSNFLVVGSLFFNWRVYILLMAIKSVPDFLFLRSMAIRWNRAKALNYFMLTALFYPWYLVLTAILSQTTRVKWKD